MGTRWLTVLLVAGLAAGAGYYLWQHGSAPELDINLLERLVAAPGLPGAVVIKVSIANVCGSDMHYWKGEQDYAKILADTGFDALQGIGGFVNDFYFRKILEQLF